MDFKVKKTDLVKELALMQGIVEKRTTIPILSNFLVSASGEDLSFTSTDLEITLHHTCPAEVKEEGSIALPTKMVYDIIRILPDADIHFKTGKESGRVQLNCGSAKYKIVCLPAEDFP
ncbi:DNA polymerase III subunit beta, partial [Acidobacteriota bacterium]